MPIQEIDWNGTGTVTLYHGTDNPELDPHFRGGRVSSDFGQGFYLTGSFDLACEWACGRSQQRGVAHIYEYEVPLRNLALFDFYNINKFRALCWVSTLLQNRLIDEAAATKAVRNFLLDNFSPSTKAADVIRGPRADAAYFGFAKAFVQNRLDVDLLDSYLENGDIGSQYCFKTFKSLEALQFKRCHTLPMGEYQSYNRAYMQRDLGARTQLDAFIEETAAHPADSVTIFRIMADWVNKSCR